MNFNLNLIRDELTSDEEEEDDNTLEEEKKIDDSNESRKKTTTISVDVPVLEEEEWNDEEIEQYKSQSRLQRISLTRRRIISAFQWSSKILWYVLAIMALIDIGIAPNENKIHGHDHLKKDNHENDDEIDCSFFTYFLIGIITATIIIVYYLNFCRNNKSKNKLKSD